MEENISSKVHTDTSSWFVMRDLKRWNAKEPAWKMLSDIGLQVFTPMMWLLQVRGHNKTRKLVPVIKDLLFVNSDKDRLDTIVARTPTLQYRFVKNGKNKPMVVRDVDMQNFIKAVEGSDSVRYYSPEEMTKLSVGKNIRIIGGPMDGYMGKLISVRGSKVKRLLVELPNLLSAGVEVKPEYIEIIDEKE